MKAKLNKKNRKRDEGEGFVDGNDGLRHTHSLLGSSGNNPPTLTRISSFPPPLLPLSHSTPPLPFPFSPLPLPILTTTLSLIPIEKFC